MIPKTVTAPDAVGYLRDEVGIYPAVDLDQGSVVFVVEPIEKYDESGVRYYRASQDGQDLWVRDDEIDQGSELSASIIVGDVPKDETFEGPVYEPDKLKKSGPLVIIGMVLLALLAGCRSSVDWGKVSRCAVQGAVATYQCLREPNVSP